MADAAQHHDDCESAYQELLEFVYLAPVGLIKLRPDGRIEMANPAAAKFLLPLAGDGKMANLYAVFAQVMPDLRGRVDRFEHPAGPVFEDARVAVPGKPLELTLGINKIDANTLMAVIKDVTRAVKQEARIRDHQLRLRAIIDNVRDYAIYTADAAGHLDEWNRSLGRLSGWEAADTCGCPIDILFPPGPEGHASAITLLERARQNGHDEYEGYGIRSNGTSFWSSTVATALPDLDGKVSGYVLITRDIAERKAKEDALVALATTDPLTGALNRRAGRTSLENAFRRWKRYGRTFAVLMIDCDHFKCVNDRFGHDVGDTVLVDLVRCCRANMRDTDIVVRWGGEEFLLLLPETGQRDASTVAERLRLEVESAVVQAGVQPVRVTVSIGVAEPTDADSFADDVVHRADRALYHAKHNGRNQVVTQ
jgi:diguanylate cyclase (GGDEF)-like protein/PAS domain S-box-containing protein